MSKKVENPWVKMSIKASKTSNNIKKLKCRKNSKEQREKRLYKTCGPWIAPSWMAAQVCACV